MSDTLGPAPDFKFKIAELEAELSRAGEPPAYSTSFGGTSVDAEAQADQEFLEAIRKAEEQEQAEEATSPAAKVRRIEAFAGTDSGATPGSVALRLPPPESERVCTDCSSASLEGALDDLNGCWYCKSCWDQVLGTISSNAAAVDAQASSSSTVGGPRIVAPRISTPVVVPPPPPPEVHPAVGAVISTCSAAQAPPPKSVPPPPKPVASASKAGTVVLPPARANLLSDAGAGGLLDVAMLGTTGQTAAAVAAAASTNSGPASALTLLGGGSVGGAVPSLPSLSTELAGLLGGSVGASLFTGLTAEKGAASGGNGANGTSVARTLLSHQADNEQRTAQWAQVFSAMLQCGIEERASEYAQYLGKLQEVTKECLKRYHEAVAMEEQLLSNAVQEASQAALMAQVQKQAQVEMASQGAQLKAEVQAAHQSAAIAVAEQESKITNTPVRRYPKRPGMPPCQFYQRTGDCHYGITCKWDHPERTASSTPLNSKGYPLRPGETPCAFYMRTGECKFAATCKWDHPESVATAAMHANAKLVEAALAGVRANEAALSFAAAQGVL